MQKWLAGKKNGNQILLKMGFLGPKNKLRMKTKKKG